MTRALLACENIRFSSLFAAGDASRETSPATKSEGKRIFSQARALPSSLRFKVHVRTVRPRSKVSDLPQGFCTLKHHNLTFEKKCLFRTLSLIDYRIIFQKKRYFEDNFSAKIEVSG